MSIALNILNINVSKVKTFFNTEDFLDEQFYKASNIALLKYFKKK